MIELRRRNNLTGAHILPNEYQQVEYLQGDGKGTYISAGITYQLNIEVDVTFRYSKYENFKSILGTYDQNSNQFKIGGEFNTPTSLFGASFYSPNVDMVRLVVSNLLLTDVFRFVLGSSYLYVYRNGLKEKSKIIQGYTNYPTFFGRELPIFCETQGSTKKDYSSSQIFVLRVKYGDELFRELIPCYRKVDNKPGMYDIVNNVFYTNAGTGEFIVGPDVN